jgi:outer membrane protein TolC
MLGAVGGQPGFSTNLTFPLPFYAAQGQVAEAEANRLRAEAQRESLRQGIALEVEEAWREARLAADQAERAARDWVPRAERFFANARKRFEAGEGTGVEVAEAQHALHEALSERQRAEAAWRHALVKLARAVGAEAWEWGA